MRRLTSFSPGVQIASAFLNSLQDDVAALLKANKNNDFTSAGLLGIDAIVWQANASMASGTLLQVDNLDWHDREILVICKLNNDPNENQRIGAANDYKFDALCTFGTAAGSEHSLGHGYLGKGGQKGGGGTVTNGNPPVPAAGTSWCVSVNGSRDAANFVALYTDTTAASYQLYCFNNLATTIQPTLWIFAIGASGLRP